MVVKLDLLKTYDRASWLYILLLLIQIGFSMLVVKWIMGCVTSTLFEVLINSSNSPLFKPSWGLRQGFPYLPICSS